MMKSLRVLASTLLCASFVAYPAMADPVRLDEPVVIEADENFAVCSLGVVVGLNPRGDGFLAVRSGPDGRFPLVDKLYNGQTAYTCADKGEWVGIVYSGHNCIPDSWKITQAYTGPCKSGWVHRKWIKIVAG